MIIKVGPCGGDGGEPFSMDNIDNITRIVKIGVAYTSTYIHAITITYIVDEEEKTVTFGGEGGTLAEFTLQPGECITSVIGYHGRTPDDHWDSLSALKFYTSRNTVLGPYGNEVGKPFELRANNDIIIGFFGHSRERLDALGAYVKVE